MPQKFLKPAFPLFLLLFCSTASLHAQDTKQDRQNAKNARIKNMVDSQNYVFTAQTALPMSGSTRQLTSDYDLKVTPTVITSYLPYFGRAYTAPINPSQGGIQFTSNNFEYKSTPRKKGGWDIQIRPKDYRDVQQMTLSISETGYATLQVTSTNRQAISFNGYIKEAKALKKKS